MRITSSRDRAFDSVLRYRRRGFLAAAAATTVALSSSAGCRRSTDDTLHVPGPMASALLAFAAQQGIPPEDIAQSWRGIDELAERVRKNDPLEGKDWVDRLNGVVFDELGFVREVAKTDADFLLLPAVLKNRRGGCLGLSALYLAVGERLRLPLAGVLVPGHFFVRAGITVEPGPQPAPRLTVARRNIELLRKGEGMSDDWYIHKYNPPSSAAPPTPSRPTLLSAPAESVSPYMRPLTIEEVIAVHWFNVGNQRREAGDLAVAADAYAHASAAFPTFAEAAAAEGVVRHLQGDLAAAGRSYDAAARVRPDLPGLAHNLAVLQAERSGPGPSAPPPARRHQQQHSGSTPRRSSP